jgi:Family of unknown function (DUF6492)
VSEEHGRQHLAAPGLLTNTEMIAFFTPTYRNDAERFQLLRDSIRRFYGGTADHVIAVPREDEELFRQLTRGDNVEVVLQNDLVDKRFYGSAWYRWIERNLPRQAWRFTAASGRSGWIIHIIVKLSLNKLVRGKPAVLLDSDSFFTRPFTDADLGNPAQQRVLVKWTPSWEIPAQQAHLRRTREILGAPDGPLAHNYQSHPEVWYPDWTEQLQQHLERRFAKPWQEALFDAGHISSSALYGTFVEEILKPPELKVRDPYPYFIAWDEPSYAAFLKNPVGSIGDNFYAVIQSNMGHPCSEYAAEVRRDVLHV